MKAERKLKWPSHDREQMEKDIDPYLPETFKLGKAMAGNQMKANPLREEHKNHVSHESEQQDGAVGLFVNRMAVCLFAVCLLWLTSLQVCVAIVGFNISVPSFTPTATSCNFAYKKVSEQRSTYAACARRQTAQCHEQLNDAYLVEKLRVAAAQQENQMFAHSFDMLASNCTAAVAMSKQAINAWASASVQNTVPYLNNCTSQGRQRVTEQLGDNSDSRSSVFAASLAYTMASDSTIERLVDYSIALNSYNAAYVYNKTKALRQLAQDVTIDVSVPHVQAVKLNFEPVLQSFDIVVGCLSLSNTSAPCPYPNNLLDEFNIQRFRALNNVAKARDAIQDAADTFGKLVNRVKVAVAAADDFFDSVQGPQGIIKWIQNNFNVPALCGKSTPNFCSFTKFSWWVDFPSLFPAPFFFIPALAEELWVRVRGIEVNERLKVQAVRVAVAKELTAWTDDVADALSKADFTPRDYNPPRYPGAANATVEARAVSQRSAAFISNMEDMFRSASNFTRDDVFDAARSVNVTSLLKNSLTSLSGYSFTWADFTSTSVDAAILIESFLTAQSLFYLFDYLYRAYLTARLVARYWNRGVVQLPKTDLRTHKPEIAQAWFVWTKRVLQWMPFISLQVMLLAIFVVFIIWSFAALFVPGYQSYMGSCVYHTSNHTFVSRNLNSLAYNFAAGEGGAVIGRGLTKYNALTGQYCSNSAAKSLQTHTAMLNQLVAANQTLALNMAAEGELRGCVDLPALDGQFYQACCASQEDYLQYAPLSGYWTANSTCSGKSVHKCPLRNSGASARAFLPPSAYLNSTTCAAGSLLRQSADLVLVNDYGSSVPAAFDCKALPKCELTCAGPDPVLVEVVTKHCSCMVEWYSYGGIIQTLLAFLAYLLLNVSRVVVMQGVVRILWKHITPARFEYTADCDLEGRVLNKALRAEEGRVGVGASDEKGAPRSDFSHALGKVIQRNAAKYERSGYVRIVVGLLVNAGWLAPLLVLRRSIAYRP